MWKTVPLDWQYFFNHEIILTFCAAYKVMDVATCSISVQYFFMSYNYIFDCKVDKPKGRCWELGQPDGYIGRDHLDEDEDDGEDVRKTLTEAESLSYLCICGSLENEMTFVSMSNIAMKWTKDCW